MQSRSWDKVKWYNYQKSFLASMPKYMDKHKHVKGVTEKTVADLHKKDLEVQGKYGVSYLKYWVDEKNENVFCLVDAPDIATTQRVHKEAHGHVADEIVEVKEGS